MVKNGRPDLKRAQRTGLSARRTRRTKSRGPKGLQLEVRARRSPRLLVFLYSPYKYMLYVPLVPLLTLSFHQGSLLLDTQTCPPQTSLSTCSQGHHHLHLINHHYNHHDEDISSLSLSSIDLCKRTHIIDLSDSIISSQMKVDLASVSSSLWFNYVSDEDFRCTTSGLPPSPWPRTIVTL